MHLFQDSQPSFVIQSVSSVHLFLFAMLYYILVASIHSGAVLAWCACIQNTYMPDRFLERIHVPNYMHMYSI